MGRRAEHAAPRDPLRPAWFRFDGPEHGPWLPRADVRALRVGCAGSTARSNLRDDRQSVWGPHRLAPCGLRAAIGTAGDVRARTVLSRTRRVAPSCARWRVATMPT